MKQSKVYIPTLKEAPSDAEAKSHKLMIRAGYIKQISAGVYAYLPLAWRVIRNIQKIIRQEMEKIDAVEMMTPQLLPADLWKQSGRYETYGDTLFKLNDRHDRDFILGPTHEETMTNVVKDGINSYKKMPITLYQMQDKFRDEDRPRYGILRGREFLMQDAYSFVSNEEDLDISFKDMEKAYRNIFDRIGLNYKVILGDAGAMGGSDSKEFSAIAEIGEDTIVYTDNGDYSANIEMAKSNIPAISYDSELKEIEKVDTPNVKSINELSEFLNVEATNIIKSMAYMSDESPVLVLVRGNYDINDVKLKNYLGSDVLTPATEDQISTLFESSEGFIGPVGMNTEVRILGDFSIKDMTNSITGANEKDKHYINTNIDEDFSVEEFGDFRTVQAGETIGDGEQLQFTKGIEIGHIFKLGTKYSESLSANFLDENGRQQPIIMGCYGIGISRLLSAICEQNADENGLVWPESIAPYQVHVIIVNTKKDDQVELSEKVTEILDKENISYLVDDRKERAGVKFADSDLIGIPYRITVGNQASESIVEIKSRKTGDSVEVNISELMEQLEKIANK